MTICFSYRFSTFLYRETGRQLAKSEIDFLIGVRGLAEEMTASAKDAGLSETIFFDDSDEAGEFLTGEIKAGDLVLVKGSRGVRTEKVIEKLLKRFDLEK